MRMRMSMSMMVETAPKNCLKKRLSQTLRQIEAQLSSVSMRMMVVVVMLVLRAMDRYCGKESDGGGCYSMTIQRNCTQNCLNTWLSQTVKTDRSTGRGDGREI